MVIAEFANIPMYKCGGCDTILQAKYYIDTGENVTSGSLENKREQMFTSSSEVNNGLENAAPPSYFTESIALNCDGKGESSEHGAYGIDAATNCDEKKDSSEHGAHGIEERDYVHDSPRTTDPLVFEIETNLNEEVEKSVKLSPQGHDSSRQSEKVEECPEPISQSVALEDMVDRGLGDGQGDSLRSTTISSHAYDGSASSSENGFSDRAPHKYMLLSKRTFRHKKFLDTIDSKGKKATTDMGSQVQFSNLPAKSPNERYASATVSSPDLNKGELSSRYGIHALERESSLDSEDFHSVQNWMEPEKEEPSRSLSRDSDVHWDSPNCQIDSPSTKFRSLKPVQMKILRKVDELRDELSELFDQTVEGKRKFHLRSIREEDLIRSLDSELVCPPRAYLPGKNVHRQFQFSQAPLSGQAHCSCLHHHPEVCRSSMQLKPNICCSNGLCRACSKAVSPPHMDSSLPPHCHKAEALDHELEKFHPKERRQPIKRHCRPVSGGAPFVICYQCLKLLQLPADFLVSKRRFHKLQCGACSEVLMYSFRVRAREIPQTPVEVQHPPSEVDNSTDANSRHEISASHSNGYVQGDRFSFSVKYGLSFAKSDSSEIETVLHVSRNSSDLMEEQNDQQVKGPQLHRLLGYPSASDLLYRLGDVDEGYQSTAPATPHFHRPSEESNTRYGLKGTGTRTPPYVHSAAGPSSNFMETREEDESPRRSRTRRGAPPLRGLLKKGIRELNHGLESVKLKIHSHGRTIPTS